MEAKTVKSYFKDINAAWYNDVSVADVYQMVLLWAKSFRAEIQNKAIIDDILYRLDDKWEDVYDVIADIIHGVRYKSLRDEMAE
jgi:hypothetical protein